LADNGAARIEFLDESGKVVIGWFLKKDKYKSANLGSR
jgi:hypothetical protein